MDAARALALGLGAVVALTATTAQARAQTPPSVVVHVHEAGGEQVVRDAIVRVVGSSERHVYIGRTGNNGEALFSGARCESGLLMVEAPDYQPFRKRISCEAAGAVIDVALERKLPTIGSTRSAPSSAKATITLGPDSALRRVNPTLIESLDQLAGLSVHGQGTGFGIGIRGQDPSMTEYSLNGAPLGAGAASLAMNSDLLSSASVDEANDSIALFSASPTAVAKYAAELRLGNYEDTFQKYQASGTVHGDGLGYVVVHTSRGIASTLNAKTYLDESGLAYEHRGVRHTTGNLVRLTDAIGATSVSFTASSSNVTSELIPAYFSGGVPAGTGPGTHQNQASSNPLVFVSVPARAGQLSLSLAKWNFAQWDDASSRLLAGNLAPQSSYSRSAGSDVAFTFSTVPSTNRAVNVSLSSVNTTASGTQLAVVGGVPFGGSFATAVHSTEASVEESWHANPRFPFGVTLKHHASDLLGGAFELGVSAQYVSPRARLRYSGTVGTKLIDLDSGNGTQVLADPGSANFDCATGAAFVTGPGVSGTRSHLVNHDLSASMSSARSNVTLSLYQHAYSNAGIGDVPFVAGSLPAAYFPTGYLASVENTYATASGCSGSLSAERIFVERSSASADIVYRGASVNGHASLSRAWSIDVNAGVERARITGGPAGLIATPYFLGSFVPGVPAYKGSVLVSWQPDERLSAVLSVSFVGPHNARQLPPYGVLNAALERRLSGSSQIALLGTNVFNTLTDPFVGPRFAVPLKDGHGVVIPTLAAPLFPRRVELRYSISTGGGLAH